MGRLSPLPFGYCNEVRKQQHDEKNYNDMKKPRLNKVKITKFNEYCKKMEECLDESNEKGIFTHWRAHNYWIVADDIQKATKYVSQLASLNDKKLYYKKDDQFWDNYKLEDYIIIQLPKKTTRHRMIESWLTNCGKNTRWEENRQTYVPMNSTRKVFIISSDIPENIISFNKRKLSKMSCKGKEQWINHEKARCHRMCTKQLNVWSYDKKLKK